MTDDIRAKIWEGCLEQREIIINDIIDERLIELVVFKIKEFNEEDDDLEAIKTFDRKANPITIYLNTPGGDIIESLSIVSAIESSKTPVHTVALGQACSGGFLILVAGHKRSAQKYSTIMWHDCSSSIIKGSNTEFKRHVIESDRQMEIANKIIKSHTKLTQDKLDEIYSTCQDWYVGADEAKKLKIIDEII